MARRYIEARENHCDAQRHAETADSWRDRRYWRKEAIRWADAESAARTTYVATVGLEVNQLDQAISHLEEKRRGLETAGQERSTWLVDHPEAVRRLRSLDRELNPLPLPEIQALGQHHAANIRRDAGIRTPGLHHGIELDFGP
jgi:hypothetical protein